MQKTAADMRIDRDAAASGPAEELALAARCREGDLSAFNTVYERYGPTIYRFCYRLVGNAEDADDLKQETFVRAWKAIGGFRGDSQLLTWLIGIAANLSSDHKRRAQARTTTSLSAADPALASDVSDPMRAVFRGETVRQVHAALGALPLCHRTVLVLHCLESLPCREIAGVLHCSLASVKIRLFRARRALRRQLEK